VLAGARALTSCTDFAFRRCVAEYNKGDGIRSELADTNDRGTFTDNVARFNHRAAGMIPECTTTILVERNTAYSQGHGTFGVPAHGIYTCGKPGLMVRSNVCYANEGSGLKFSASSRGGKAHRNVTWGNGTMALYRDGGFLLQGEDPGFSPPSYVDEVFHHVDYASRYGLSLSIGVVGSSSLVKSVKNCIFANAVVAGVSIENGTDTITVFHHNDVFGAPTKYTGLSDQTGLNNNISVDPKFVAPTIGDFHLQPGSPCRGVGADLNV
jgi:hypothetical protein